MTQEILPVVQNEEVSEGIFRLTFRSKQIAAEAKAGQFLNVRVSESVVPVLRRPFSISEKKGESFSILFNIVGIGTRILAEKRKGDAVDAIGPLGNGFAPFITDSSFDMAVIVAGGMGVAPIPFLISSLPKKVDSMILLGARTSSQLVKNGLENLSIATDDGSEGMHGTVIDLLKKRIGALDPTKTRIFSCGPTMMMKALAEIAGAHSIPCFLSLECEMACGIGLCQGCPIPANHGEKKYLLVCKDGPVFNSHSVYL